MYLGAQDAATDQYGSAGQTVNYLSVCLGAQDASTDQYGSAWQTVIILLILYHWLHHVSWLDARETSTRYVYHRRQVPP